MRKIKLLWNAFFLAKDIIFNEERIAKCSRYYIEGLPEELKDQIGEERYEGLRDVDAIYRFFFLAERDEINSELKVFDNILK